MSRTVWLLDANLLIALTHAAHVHHADAHAWFAAAPKRPWATCALTQLAYVRLSSNPRVAGATITPVQAMQALNELVAHPGHQYWNDAPEPVHLPTLKSPALVGHRQVSDAYLLGIAAQHAQKLATLDRGFMSYATTLGLQRHVEWVGTQPTVQEPKAIYEGRRRHGRL